MYVNKNLWPSRRSDGADVSTIEELVGIDLSLWKGRKIGRVELGLVRIPMFWEWIDPITRKNISRINYYTSRLKLLIDTRNRVDADHEKLVQQVIPDFHIIRPDDYVMSRTAVIRQREHYETLKQHIRMRAIDEAFLRKIIPDFEDRLDRMYETGETRNWATDQRKIIDMLAYKYHEWVSEVGRVYLNYLTDSGLDTFLNRLTDEDTTRYERWIHDVGASYLDHLDTVRTAKQYCDWLLNRKIPTIVKRFERLIEREARFVGMLDGVPMVDRKTLLRRSMLERWADKFYRDILEL
ncbi:MAG: hypothetical protein U9N07_05090, partial [Euryarchaeota archaeon]|nr:hypothetical protein [Euryarchaeota archaeon]